MSRSTVLLLCLTLLLLSASALPSAAAQSMVIRNNYDVPYSGPVTFKTSLPDGYYGGQGAAGSVSAGVAHVTAKLPAHGSVRLERASAERSISSVVQVDPKIAIAIGSGIVTLRRGGDEIGSMSLGLSVIPGRTASTADAVSQFQPISVPLTKTSDAAYSGVAQVSGYEIKLNVRPYGSAWIDFSAELTNVSGDKSSAYIALVRKVSTSGATGVHMRWNGRFVDGATEPTDYVGSYAYTQCVDWCAWHAGDASWTVANGFTPGFTVEQSSGKWVTANHFYVWEHMLKQGDGLYFVSEIAGPDPAQKPGYNGVKAYTPPVKGEPVKLHWRLAVASKPESTWPESQFLVSAGYRKVSSGNGAVTVDLGVPYVEFGTSYFPYSTMCENFDYYRTPGLDREGWWPFSPKMWENWRAFVPQMQTDLRIIRAMGLEWVRMHHLELIGEMDRKNAMEFMDFYMNECRKLGLKVLIDTEGTPQWFATLAGRYKDVVKRIEIENEVLIPGITPGEPERWKACYEAAKTAAPGSDVFLTGNANVGMFDRLTQLGVPWDRLGYHTYKHGPGGEETLSSLALAAAGVAADRGTTPVLSEFNWKFLTRLSPEARAKEWALIFGDLLGSRAVPELLQFHWQETMCVNPLLCRQGIRHYETIYLDRRPKPEALEFMKLIRQYSRPDASVRELPIRISAEKFVRGEALAFFTVTNSTSRTIALKLTPECFGNASCRLASPGAITLRPWKSAKGVIRVSLKPNALPGVYHFFLKAACSGKTAYGWGYASNIGDAIVDPRPVLADLVDYPRNIATDGVSVWSRTQCVAFGADAPVVELEMAYMVANTLQSATGRSIRLCSTADIPEGMIKAGTLVLVGTPESNPLIAQKASLLHLSAGKGAVMSLNTTNGVIAGSWLLLTGDSSKSVEAAATEFVLRYWKNAKDASIRISGMEEGAALGKRSAPGQINPP